MKKLSLAKNFLAKPRPIPPITSALSSSVSSIITIASDSQ